MVYAGLGHWEQLQMSENNGGPHRHCTGPVYLWQQTVQWVTGLQDNGEQERERERESYSAIITESKRVLVTVFDNSAVLRCKYFHLCSYLQCFSYSRSGILRTLRRKSQ